MPPTIQPPTFEGSAGGKQTMPEGVPPGSIPVPGMPGYWQTPFGEIGYIETEDGTDLYGNPTTKGTFTTIPLSLARQYMGLSGSGGPSYPPAHTDPRYWDLQYRELYEQARNNNLDANSARQQARATLEANMRNAGIDMVTASTTAAKIAADYAANPRDAVAELNFRNAAAKEGQGATPFGAAMSSPSFPQYQSALENKFQELFGGVGGDLARAREMVAAPIPQEYLPNQQPPTMQLPQQENGLAALQNAFATGGFREDGLTGDLTPKGEDFIKWVTATNGGVQPATAEDGVNMNIMEPAMVIGQSGRVYATLAETDPEELIVKPLPSVVERKKKEKEEGKKFMQATQGAQRMQSGGSASVIPDTTDFINQLRQALSGLGGSGGGTGQFATELPDLRLLAGAPAAQLAQDPDLMDYALAGYSRRGISPRSVAATLQRFTPEGIMNNFPRLSF